MNNPKIQDRYAAFRDHYSKFGWGVRDRKTNIIVALIGDKSLAMGFAALLNGDKEKADIFMDEDYVNTDWGNNAYGN